MPSKYTPNYNIKNIYYKLKSQKEADFSKQSNITPEKIDSKLTFDLSSDNLLNANKRNIKSIQNYSITTDSMNNSYNMAITNKSLNYPELQQVQKMNFATIEEKYDKYKNWENPFTIPDMPNNEAKERRIKIIKRINKERMKYQSKSVDSTISKNKFHKKRNSHLENNLFENNE